MRNFAGPYLTEHGDLTEKTYCQMDCELLSPAFSLPSGKRPRALLFDFDLTLADGSAWIVHCYRTVLARHGFAPRPDEDIRATIGLTVEDSFARLTGVADRGRLVELRAEYKALCRPQMAAHTSLFPDAGRFLRAARAAGLRLAVVSTKETPTLRDSLARCGVEDLFDVVVGLDEVSAPKPSPEGIRFALARLGVAAEEAVYFGDNPVDGAAAEAAHVAYVGVAKGVHPAEALAAFPHLAVVRSYDELLPQQA